MNHTSFSPARTMAHTLPNKMGHKILQSALLFCAALLLVSCMKSNVQKLDGEWQCDAQATVALYKGTLKDLPKASELASTMLDNLSYLFYVEGKKVTRTFSGLATVSDFTLVSEKDANVVLQIEGTEMHIQFTDDNTIAVTSGDNDSMKMIFTRVKK